MAYNWPPRPLPPPPPPPTNQDEANQRSSTLRPLIQPLRPQAPLQHWNDMEELMSVNYLDPAYYGNNENFPSPTYRQEATELLRDKFQYFRFADVNQMMEDFGQNYLPAFYVFDKGLRSALTRFYLQHQRQLRGMPISFDPALPLVTGHHFRRLRLRSVRYPRRVEYGDPADPQLAKEYEWMREIPHTPVWQRIQAAGLRAAEQAREEADEAERLAAAAAPPVVVFGPGVALANLHWD